MKLVSLFTGCGGLDLGFHKAGFETVWANEYDKTIWETIRHNFPNTELDTRSISDIPASEVPDGIDGLIGGPPCQSWSAAGAGRGILDKRGQLFHDYIRILAAKSPKFFLAENVSGMLHQKHSDAFSNIKEKLADVGYTITQHLVNAHDYGVAQDRKRVFFIGFRKDLGLQFELPDAFEDEDKKYLKDVIWDLRSSAVPALEKNKTNPKQTVSNHEYMIGGFSTMYMSRNRVRAWDEPSFTIQAGGRHAPMHPQAPKMELIGKDKRRFVPGHEGEYRRLSIRECARIQSFPDSHLLKYINLADGYKMIGNAVPVDLAYVMADQIRNILTASKKKKAA